MEKTLTAPETSPAEWREVSGITTRLAAGLRSIRARGFEAEEFFVAPRPLGGWHWLRWHSSGGVFSDRAWTVTAYTRLVEGPNRIEVRGAKVAVRSPGTGEWTAWRGGCLDEVISRRLDDVVTVIGARSADPTSTLTDAERRCYHDLHPSPVKAWGDGQSRVLLEDDPSGRGSLYGRSSDPDIVQMLLRHGWSVLIAKQVR